MKIYKAAPPTMGHLKDVDQRVQLCAKEVSSILEHTTRHGILTQDLMNKYGVSRRTLAYWRGTGSRPKNPASTYGCLREGTHWQTVGRTVVFTEAGEKAVKKMAKSSRIICI